MDDEVARDPDECVPIDWMALSPARAEAFVEQCGVSQAELLAACDTEAVFLTQRGYPAFVLLGRLLDHVQSNSGPSTPAARELLRRYQGWLQTATATATVSRSRRPRLVPPDPEREIHGSAGTSSRTNSTKIVEIEIDSLSISPSLKALVPRPSPEQREALKRGLVAEGCNRDPIHVRASDRTVFDGFARLDILKAIGKTTALAALHDIPLDDDLVERTIRAAVERRQLTPWQLVKMAPVLVKIEEDKARKRMLAGRRSDDDPVDETPQGEKTRAPATRDIVAAALGFGSGRQLDRGLAILGSGRADLIALLDAGDLSISAAYDRLREGEDKAQAEDRAESAEDQHTDASAEEGAAAAEDEARGKEGEGEDAKERGHGRGEEEEDDEHAHGAQQDETEEREEEEEEEESDAKRQDRVNDKALGRFVKAVAHLEAWLSEHAPDDTITRQQKEAVADVIISFESAQAVVQEWKDALVSRTVARARGSEERVKSRRTRKARPARRPSGPRERRTGLLRFFDAGLFE